MPLFLTVQLRAQRKKIASILLRETPGKCRIELTRQSNLVFPSGIGPCPRRLVIDQNFLNEGGQVRVGVDPCGMNRGTKRRSLSVHRHHRDAEKIGDRLTKGARFHHATGQMDDLCLNR